MFVSFAFFGLILAPRAYFYVCIARFTK